MVEVSLGTLLLSLVLPQIVRVNTILADEATISLGDSDKKSTLLNEELARPVSHISETLHDEAFSLKTLSDSQLSQLLLIVEDLLGRVEDSQTSCLLSSADTVVGYTLAGGHTSVVDITSAVEVVVLVLNESHLPLTSADIGARHVDGGTKTGLFAKSSSIVSGNALDLSLGETAGIDLDASLSTSIGQSGDGVLDGHQAGEGLDLLEIDTAGITRSTLGGETVGLVLDTVGFDDLDESGV